MYIYTEQRPWGSFSILEESKGYKVKKIVVLPKERLSLQYHHHREEKWIVVKGNPVLQIGELSRKYHIGETVEVKKGQLHRIDNDTEEKVIIIEIQLGDYLEEDDIVRLQDDYSR